jgi:uncharacterized repeat protein (TIGR03803 family)
MERIVSFLRRACGFAALCTASAVISPAQTFATLFSFDGSDGAFPAGALVQALNGALYGTTRGGGHYAENNNYGEGTIFEITPGGAVTTVYRFCVQSDCPDGAEPDAGLLQDTNGDLYGTTYNGGADDRKRGTVFKVTPVGALTTLYTFCIQPGCLDGRQPGAGLIQAANGSLYGTTFQGGYSAYGTIFEITPSGTLTTLYNFCECPDGAEPEAGLLQATNGALYGTTWWAGGNGVGTVFEFTPSGTLTSLYSFGGVDGANPAAGLIQATNGSLYGTTLGGGAYGGGTIFSMTLGGTLTTLYSFCAQSGCADGSGPVGGLIQATDGNLYGMTGGGGANSAGTVFKITPSGALTTLYNFCSLANCVDGSGPAAGLLQATNGSFYGTTYEGGANGDGTVFSLAVGLAPFVESLPSTGKISSRVQILGTDLTGAISVAFNDTPTEFFVVSPSLITATVPAGATTGTIQVVTPNGTLSSNVPFRVLQ